MLTLESILHRKKAVLVLQNGTILHGFGIGASKRAEGELVFTTFTGAGYACALTDPSNQGQLYILTYPLVGNYGIPDWEEDTFGIMKHFESTSIKCTGFIVHEACQHPSHYEASKTLDQFLQEEGIPGIEGIDTRYLTQILRTEGVQTGFLQVFDTNEPIPSDQELLTQLNLVNDPNDRHLVQEVSTQTIRKFIPSDPIGKVVVVDCGVKNNILRSLLDRQIEVILVPFNKTFGEIMAYSPDGVVLSNGPGDPKKCLETIELTKDLIKHSIPTFGICLGNQIICLAAGGDTYKLKYGHRGGNKPVIDLRTQRAYITSQNHGYCVSMTTLEHSGFKPMFKNADDHTNEGIYHESKPIFGVQFHPEAYPGPEDTAFLFDEFLKNIAFHKFIHNPSENDQVEVV